MRMNMNAPSGPLVYHNDPSNCGPLDIVARLQEFYWDYEEFQWDPFQTIPIYKSIVNQVSMTQRDGMGIFIPINEFEIHVDSDPFIIIRRGAESCLSLRHKRHRDSPQRDNWEILDVGRPTMLCDKDQIRMQTNAEYPHNMYFEFQQLINGL